MYGVIKLRKGVIKLQISKFLVVFLIAITLLAFSAQSMSLTELMCLAGEYNPGFLKACLFMLMWNYDDPYWGDEDTADPNYRD